MQRKNNTMYVAVLSMEIQLRSKNNCALAFGNQIQEMQMGTH